MPRSRPCPHPGSSPATLECSRRRACRSYSVRATESARRLPCPLLESSFPSLLLLDFDCLSFFQAFRTFYDERVSRINAREHIHIGAALCAERYAAAFQRTIFHEQHIVTSAIFLYGSLRNDCLGHHCIWILLFRCGIFKERNFHAHVRQNFVVQFVDRNTYLDRRFLAIRAWNNRSHVRGIFVLVFGIGIEPRFDLLVVFYFCNVSLIDVHLDLVGLHVHDRGDASARKSAASRNWRDHFADLRVFGNDSSRERRTNGAVVYCLLCLSDARFGSEDLLLGQCNLGFQAVNGSTCVIQRFLRLNFCLHQVLGAFQLDLRQLQLNLQVGNLRRR